MPSTLAMFFSFFFVFFASTIFLNVFSFLILLYFLLFLSSLFTRPLRFFSRDWNFYLTMRCFYKFLWLLFHRVFYTFFFLAFGSLNFLYFSLIYLTASCPFFPGSSVSISSKIFIVSTVSAFFGMSSVFVLEMQSLLVLFFLAFDAKLSFLKSVESISVLIKSPASLAISFVVFFREERTYNLFYLDLLYQDSRQFLTIPQIFYCFYFFALLFFLDIYFLFCLQP